MAVGWESEISLIWSAVLQEEVRRLDMLCEAEQETVPEEAQRQLAEAQCQLADAGVALSKALEECRAVLRQNRQVRGLLL